MNSQYQFGARRSFLKQSAAIAIGAGFPCFDRRCAAQASLTEDGQLAFTPAGEGFRFDTGSLRGTLHDQGRSLGLLPITDSATGASLGRSMGICSHYRLLDSQHRYGHAAWDWPSQTTLLQDGAVEVRWTADEEHPFSMTAVYRWADTNTLDVTTTVATSRRLEKLEVFLASYFEGFESAFVFADPESVGDGKGQFLKAEESNGTWQMFPRDQAAVDMIADGRWQRLPHPVQWAIMPRLAGPLAMRRDTQSGLAGLVMSPPGDCFAVSTPYSEESHRSLYLSLFGRDFTEGESATARARLIIAREITDQRALELYRAYLR